MTELDFKCMVHDLGFEHYAEDDTYTYRVPGEDWMCTLVADFKSKEIRWPRGMTVTMATTSNFSQPENFVVFECVYRLLKQGYRPKDIELEPKWKVGHGASGGRADIWVRTKMPGDDSYESLLIIECKTFGREFNSAWKDTLEDGDQLFGYFAQEPTTKFLCLYASEYQNDELEYTYHLINVQDNEEYVKTLKSPATFEKGKLKGRKELFKAWRETYKQDYATIGLFEKGIEAYHPGKSEYTVDDLKAVDAVEIGKMYHRFAETLRKYNVSGRENAFDKLVNLMLAKVVDELQNPKLQFNWKGAAYDDDFRLQDRLQKLYKEGMQKFLGEDVTYIDDSQIDKAFRRFKNDPDATRDAIRKFVRELKFFTNNDFAFIDVHNENLFNKNAEVLRSVVRMLQDVRLRTDAENQFLGDLFENFLDQGVKQSEGQFFTPIPFVRFMISSLPIAETIEKMPDPPIMVDYACGAGHFLNEYARQVANKVPNEKRSDYYRNIYGIEKEYRLSKVSKVASFMYGQDQINIIYSDALVKDEKVKDGTVTFLATNPPYSVKGFLETLTEEQRKAFKLSEAVDDLAKNDDIECFFIERAAQLLAPGGMAAIVLPSSILNNGNIYVKCREILLESFDIVAIVEMGNGTFGKTNTSTATLFLRRKDSDTASHIKNRVESWFKGDFTKDEVFKDSEVRAKYAAVIGVDSTDYDEFLKGKAPQALMDSEVFAAYRETFRNSSRAKMILKKKLKPNYTAADRDKELDEYIIAEMRAVEQEKLRIFMLAEENPQPVLVVRGPVKSGEIKDFLGYEWSSRKGEEGLHILGAQEEDEDGFKGNRGIDQIRTPLFNPVDINDQSKICKLVRDNFLKKIVDVPADVANFITRISLSSTIDFRRREFDKTIRTSGFVEINLESRYAAECMSSLVETTGGLWTGEKPPFKKVRVLRNTNFSLTGEIDYSDVAELQVEERSFQTRRLEPGDVIIEKSGGSDSLAVGRVVLFDKEDGDYSYSNFTARLRIKDKEKILPYYLHLIMNTLYQMGASYTYQHGAAGIKNLRLDDYLTKKIPVPPMKEQKKLVAECEKIDKEVASAKEKIVALKTKKETAFDALSDKPRIKISTLCKYSDQRVSLSDIDPKDYISTDNMLQHCEGIVPYEGIPKVDKVVAYAKGDVLVSNIRPYLQKIWHADRAAGCSPDVLAIRLKDGANASSEYLYYALKRTHFFEFVMAGNPKGLKMPRGDKNRVMQFEIPQISRPEQDKLVADLRKIEGEIAALKKLIGDNLIKKAKLVEEFLK